MHLIATLHRWWGVAFCLLFAMWFASGIAMHFVPFPARSEAPLPGGLDALRATAESIDYDQWTVGSDFDSDRPLTHVTVNDDVGTELYISTRSGKIVLTTTRGERLLNYAGSVAHWLYPTPLRHHRRVWTALMWWLSLLATAGAALGVVLGVTRFCAGPVSRGLKRWHHIGGLILAPFILCWIFSGFLSMDEGLLPHGEKLFHMLHTLDFPPLTSHPRLRSSVVISLCLCGLAFSLTGVLLAWRAANGSREAS